MKANGEKIGTPAPEMVEHSVPAEVLEAHKKWMLDGTVSTAYLSSMMSGCASSQKRDTGSSTNFCGRFARTP
jgi:tellurite resistance protein